MWTRIWSKTCQHCVVAILVLYACRLSLLLIRNNYALLYTIFFVRWTIFFFGGGQNQNRTMCWMPNLKFKILLDFKGPATTVRMINESPCFCRHSLSVVFCGSVFINRYNTTVLCDDSTCIITIFFQEDENYFLVY